MLSTIPFSGFYHTFHESEIDRVATEWPIDRYAEETGEDMPQFLADKLWETVNYGDVFALYAADYAGAFLEWLGLDGKFESMSSPREYNFATDRIFVELTRDDVAKLWRGVDRERFAKLARERFTSRSGFMSYYSPDWRDWGRLSDWDHNALGTLLQAYAETEQGSDWDSYHEVELMEGATCNGDVDNWIAQTSPDWVHLMDVVDYMIARAQRPCRTMAQQQAARRAEMRPYSGTPLGQWAGA